MIDFYIRYISSDIYWDIVQILLTIILLVFYWYAGGRDFFKKLFKYQGKLSSSVIIECSSAECEMLCLIASKLSMDNNNENSEKYVSPILFTKIDSDNSKLLHQLESKHYLIKIEALAILRLEKAINELRPKNIEMDAEHTYYLISNKFSKVFYGTNIVSDDFEEVYYEI